MKRLIGLLAVFVVVSSAYQYWTFARWKRQFEHEVDVQIRMAMETSLVSAILAHQEIRATDPYLAYLLCQEEARLSRRAEPCPRPPYLDEADR